MASTVSMAPKKSAGDPPASKKSSGDPPAPKKSSGDHPPVVVGEKVRDSTAPGIEGAHVDEVTLHISHYLRSYAALSVELLGRWPAYVPESERHFVNPESWTTADLAPTMPPHLLRPAPDEVPEEKGKKGKKAQQRPTAANTATDEEMEKLKAVVEGLNEKMRAEVEAKQKALKAVAKLTAQTLELTSQVTNLQEAKEKEGSTGEKLQRDVLRLEEEARNANRAKVKAEAQGAKDRKARTLAQMRLDTLQKDTAPLVRSHLQPRFHLQRRSHLQPRPNLHPHPCLHIPPSTPTLLTLSTLSSSSGQRPQEHVRDAAACGGAAHDGGGARGA